jgi:DNA-binding NtrC family response regulator
MSSSPRGKLPPTARGLARLLDSRSEAIWILDSSNRIAWMNQACGEWVGAEPIQMLGRVAAMASTSSDPLDGVAACLSAPLGLDSAGLICAICEPSGGAARHVRYLHVGEPGEPTSAIVIASTGTAVATLQNAELRELSQIREQLQSWRKKDFAWGGIASAGSSRASKRLRAQIKLAVGTREDISIVGPAGCGGEAIARCIHAQHSGSATTARFANEPFIAIEGPLMDAELLDASLSPAASHLGGDRVDDQQRLVSILVRGLDETPLDVQQRIEQFVVEHPGAIRLIGLLSKPVKEAAAEETLIAALAARLEVLTIQIESLAARTEDIPLIASAMVDTRHAANAGPAERLNRAALDRLTLYLWPSNFDELDAAIRHAMSTCTGPAIGPEHLPLAIRSYRPNEPVRANEVLDKGLDEAMERFELRMINAAIDAADGNRSEAARRLGISRARLLRRLGEADKSGS